jgi:hypothetical protein
MKREEEEESIEEREKDKYVRSPEIILEWQQQQTLFNGRIMSVGEGKS